LTGGSVGSYLEDELIENSSVKISLRI